MGVRDLFRKGESTPVAYECDQCSAFWDNAQDCAWCCGPVSCEKCSKVISKTTSMDYGGLCWECRRRQINAEESSNERRRVEQSRKLTWAEKPDVVCFPDISVGDNGFWFDDEPPEGDHEYAWACSVDRPAIEASSVIESILDDYGEESIEMLGPGAHEGMQARLDEWLEMFAGDVKAFFPNYDVCVLLPGKVQ